MKSSGYLGPEMIQGHGDLFDVTPGMWSAVCSVNGSWLYIWDCSQAAEASYTEGFVC